MRILTMDSQSANHGSIANGAGTLFLLAAVVYAVLVVAEARNSDSYSNSIIKLSADDLPFVENTTFGQPLGGCISKTTEVLAKINSRMCPN
ncbi:MAG: hypothetical protein WCJ64_21965 [Rhodospirillaceae bacterium]